jgi:hypothetical protein
MLKPRKSPPYIAIGALSVHLWTCFTVGRLPQVGFLQMADAGEISKQFHVVVTLLAAAWAMLALGILLCLQQRIFPHWLPYFSTACDIVILTSIICVADGPRSVLVVGYLLILVLATLRRLPLKALRHSHQRTCLFVRSRCARSDCSVSTNSIRIWLIRVPCYQHHHALSIALAGAAGANCPPRPTFGHNAELSERRKVDA